MIRSWNGDVKVMDLRLIDSQHISSFSNFVVRAGKLGSSIGMLSDIISDAVNTSLYLHIARVSI